MATTIQQKAKRSCTRNVTVLDMLELHVVPQCQDTGCLATVDFQQDSAPSHWAREVRDFMNEKYGDNWRGRGGPIQRPPLPKFASSLSK
jgi:hypothetical protein